MTEYIKREDAIRETVNALYRVPSITVAEIVIALEDLPAADVVEVVRCKDCKYWDTRDSNGIQGICLCGEKDFYYGSEFYPFADDYCSYGERREK